MHLPVRLVRGAAAHRVVVVLVALRSKQRDVVRHSPGRQGSCSRAAVPHEQEGRGASRHCRLTSSRYWPLHTAAWHGEQSL